MQTDIQNPFKVGPAPRPNRLDFWQALTGIILFLFICAHALFESTVILSPSILNWIAWFFEATYMAQIGAPIILLLVVIHFIIAARKMPFHAGDLKTFWDHSKRMKHQDTTLWLIQVVTAIFILVMVSAHIYTVLSTLPITDESIWHRIHHGWFYFFIILLLMVGLHAFIGLYRLGVKYGFITRENRARCRRNILVAGGFYVLLTFGTLIRLITMAEPVIEQVTK